MSMSDPLADMLTRIRNAGMVHKEVVDMPYSKMKQDIANILRDEGYIVGSQMIEEKGPQNSLRVNLKYDRHGQQIITGLRRVSKPGCRVYARYDALPAVMSGLGISIVSTSHGVISARQARAKKIGGEIICEVW
ncbi:MAG: 30S ribosomal protein S8 [Deltaproteobacteria bacterium]|nr:30S ribosomal protein S8 [Deltaproteobacteria bacterium]